MLAKAASSSGLQPTCKAIVLQQAKMVRRRRAALYIIATTQALTLPTLRRRRKAPPKEELEKWLDTAATVRVRATPDECYAAYADLTRMPEWCPLLSEVTFDPETRKSEWRMGFKGVSVGWTAENLEESPPSLLRWTSKAGTENYGAASFTPTEEGTEVEVKITYRTPRAIYSIVEGRRAQSIIRSLLRATLVRFGKKMEGMFPEDDQLVADRIVEELAE